MLGVFIKATMFPRNIVAKDSTSRVETRKRELIAEQELEYFFFFGALHYPFFSRLKFLQTQQPQQKF